jgi:hypothetical protein
MAQPRFRPASLFARPRDFGRISSAQPLRRTSLSPGERVWALFQHDVACAVIFELSKRKWDIARLAKKLGRSEDWLKRLLYGRAPANLAEMAEWAMALGIDLPLPRMPG